MINRLSCTWRQALEVQRLFSWMCFSLKTMVFVRVYNQQFQRAVLFMVFDFQASYISSADHSPKFNQTLQVYSLLQSLNWGCSNPPGMTVANEGYLRNHLHQTHDRTVGDELINHGKRVLTHIPPSFWHTTTRSTTNKKTSIRSEFGHQNPPPPPKKNWMFHQSTNGNHPFPLKKHLIVHPGRWTAGTYKSPHLERKNNDLPSKPPWL